MARADSGQAHEVIDRALAHQAGRQVRQALPAMAIGIALVGALLWDHVQRAALMSWLAAGAADVVRAAVRNVHDTRRHRSGLAPPVWWDRANHASFGLLWGSLSVVAACWGDDTARWSALVLLLGVVTMAVAVSAGTTERFVIIAAAALGPTFVVTMARPGWRAIGVCVLVFAAIAATVQRALHRALVDTARTAEDNRALAQRLERFLADRDPATSLLSRRGLATALDDAATGPGPCTVVVANVERLATVNELFGEQAGDAVLRVLAARLGEAFTADHELVARIGGDEFAVAVHGALDPDLVSRVRATAAEPVALEARTLQVELHTAEASGCRTDAADLLAAAMADVTRLRAQRRGGLLDAVDPLPVRRALLDDLPAALRGGDVTPWFQPILDAASHEVVGWEALVRWRHGSLGVLTPDRFLPLAVMAGLGDALTDVVLDASLAFLASVGRSAPHGRPLRLHVNIEPSDLRRTDVPDRVVRALRAHDVPPDALVLEVTEQDVLAIDDVVRANLEALDRLGVDIAVDDFGTGFSSLSHLQLLPVRQLKIDRLFIAALDTPRAATLVEGVIGLARGMRLGVVAEGVETEAQAARLATMGCAELQGFLFAPAMPPEEAACFSRQARAGDRAAARR